MLHFSAPSRALALGLVLSLVGCAYSDAYEGYHSTGTGAPGTGGYGATPGGAQDIGYARMLVASGTVPSAEAITTEGLLGTYDIPIDGAPCTDLLCVRPSVGVAPSLATGRQEQWVVLGMTSGITDFHRPPIDLALVLDASASMSGDMPQVIEASTRLVRALRADDRISLVVFRDQPEVVRPMTPRGDDPSELVTQLHQIRVSGNAGLIQGLEVGYQQVRGVGDDPTRLRRVVTFSCGYAARQPVLEALVRDGGEERIGLTFVGVLLGYDTELASLLGVTRGGNAFYTASLDDIERVLDTDLDFTLTPLAYDMHLGLTLEDGWALDHVYGVPADETGAPRVAIDVSTAFISRDHGAVVARLTRSATAGDAIGAGTLSYVPESALGWNGDYDANVAITEPMVADGAASFEGVGVRKAVALVNEAEQLRAACTSWAAHDAASARATTDGLLTYLRAEAEATSDPDLRTEVTFVESFRALLGPS